MDEDGIEVDLEHTEIEAEEAHCVWQYFAVTNSTEAKKGGSKNACCMFCDSFQWLQHTAAHILERPITSGVTSKDKAEIQPCVAINKKDDGRRGSLRKARKIAGNITSSVLKNNPWEDKKRRQEVMDEIVRLYQKIG